jgi:iron complex outermembrane receptor protein
VPSLLWEHHGGRLVVGGDWYTFHSKHWGDVLMAGPDENNNLVTPFDIPGGVKYHAFTGEKEAWSAYLNERWEFLPGLTLLADLQFQHRQYDFIQEDVGNFTGDLRNAYSVEYDFFNPKGGLFWQTPGTVAGGRLGVYGHVGVTQREPADSDYWGVWAGPDDLGQTPLFRQSRVVLDAGGNVQYVQWRDPEILEEKVTNYEVGLAYRTRNLSATVNGYYMDFENEIVGTGYYDPDRRANARTNAERTIHRGIEAGVRWQLNRDHGLSVGLSFSDNKFDRFTFSVPDTVPGNPPLHEEDNSGNPISLFPNSMVSATWTSRVGAVSGDLNVRTVGRQFLDNSGDDFRTISGSTVVNLTLFLDLGRAGVRALDGMEAYLRVFNLLGEEYETFGYFDPWGGEGEQRYFTPGAPRHFLVGVNYDF